MPKMSLYDHHLSLSALLLLASVSVDSSPIFKMSAIYMIQLSPSGVNWLDIYNLSDLLCSVLNCCM